MLSQLRHLRPPSDRSLSQAVMSVNGRAVWLDEFVRITEQRKGSCGHRCRIALRVCGVICALDHERGQTQLAGDNEANICQTITWLCRLSHTNPLAHKLQLLNKMLLLVPEPQAARLELVCRRPLRCSMASHVSSYCSSDKPEPAMSNICEARQIEQENQCNQET